MSYSYIYEHLYRLDSTPTYTWFDTSIDCSSIQLQCVIQLYLWDYSVCDLTHTAVTLRRSMWRDSFLYTPWLILLWVASILCVPWCILTCVPWLHVPISIRLQCVRLTTHCWDVVARYVTWLIPTCAVTHSNMTCVIRVCSVTRYYVTWLIPTCAVTLFYVTCLIPMCAATLYWKPCLFPCAPWLVIMWHDLFPCALRLCYCVPCLIPMCTVTL